MLKEDDGQPVHEVETEKINEGTVNVDLFSFGWDDLRHTKQSILF